MELSHSLTLNEEALKLIPDAKKSLFIFEWLRFLDKVLIAAQKSDIKECQKKLVEQLLHQLQQAPGPPTRVLISRCLATLFTVGDTFLLFECVNKCNDFLKPKDDSPSYLPTRLAAIVALGMMYEKLGRMMGRSYEETVQLLVKYLRSAESQARIHVLQTFQSICLGMGSAASSVHRDIYKAARQCLTDRVMPVRCAAAKCLISMVPDAPFLYTSELENLSTLCFRAMDGSNYEVRCTVAQLLGTLLAMTQQLPKQQQLQQGLKQEKQRLATLEEAMNILFTGFIRGGVSGMMKTPSSVSREVRVGVTHAYVVFINNLGSLWLERNLSQVLGHVLEVVANPRVNTSHVDSVYARKCVSFILRSLLGKMLGEKAQIAACKEVCLIISRQLNNLDTGDIGKDGPSEGYASANVLVCAFSELGTLISTLGTCARSLLSDTSANVQDLVVSSLVGPSPAVRYAGAWCLRCIGTAVPSLLTPLIDKCSLELDNMKNSGDAIRGLSAGIAALLGSAPSTPLGIPQTRGKYLFNVAEDLLRSANQNSRLSLPRTQAGWIIIGAIMTLGVPVVRSLLPRMLLLWRNAFPRSQKELDSELARGDAFTWQVTLEGRAGALSSIHSYLVTCPELATDENIRRLQSPIDGAVTMLSSISALVKSNSQHLKASAAMVRLRLFEVLSCLPPQPTQVLRLLVAEIALNDNPANTTTSLLQSLCHATHATIIGSWLLETDHHVIEDQLQPNSASGSGALEHDDTFLYRQCLSDTLPLPLGVSVIDKALELFGHLFPHCATKHKVQMMEHFSECLKQAKAARHEALLINFFTAILSGLKHQQGPVGNEDVTKSMSTLILGGLTHQNALIRAAAAEAMGRISKNMGTTRFGAEMAQTSFDKLKSARDAVSRTGHSLVLGCLHHHVGGMGSSQHLNTSVSILLALAQDLSSPLVQVWALHALALIADSGGPMFRSYVEPALSLSLTLLLSVSPHHTDVHHCIGKVLSALINTVGPELQGNTSTVSNTRWSLLCAAAIMQEHADPLVQAQAIACLQQLHMFAPRHVNLSSLVPTLCQTLGSRHLLLRKAAVSCLRQLVQREAWEVCEHAVKVADEAKEKGVADGLLTKDAGLPGGLFAMLNAETDSSLIKEIQNTLNSLLLSLVQNNLGLWVRLCKEVLSVASDTSSNQNEPGKVDVGQGGDEEGDGDMEEVFGAEEEQKTHPSLPPRWPTRVFAAQCVQRIISLCEDDPVHFDIAAARELALSKGRGDALVLHLSDLIRVAFMAATSDCDPLRLEGLQMLQNLITKFAAIPEPEFPGHSILEQYQAQVGAALRPAFAQETPSHVTSKACQVCSTWIGSGVAKDLSDLKRVHHLLVSSLPKLKQSNSSQVYNESAMTLEKLSILKAWAEVYIVAMKGASVITGKRNAMLESEAADDDEFGESRNDREEDGLLNLVKPELISLSKHWLAALKDHALLSLPQEFESQLPHDGGAFYTHATLDLARPHYRVAWPALLHAAALWINDTGFQNVHLEKSEVNVSGSANLGLGPANAAASKSPEEINSDRFHLIFGVCMEALCHRRASDPVDNVLTCLKALYCLLDSPWPRGKLFEKRVLAVELCTILHRLLLTSENAQIQLSVLDVIDQVIRSAQEKLEEEKKNKRRGEKHGTLVKVAQNLPCKVTCLQSFWLSETVPANQEPKELPDCDLLGEGGESGEIEEGKSVVYSILEVSLCILIRQIPTLSPSVPSTPMSNSLYKGKHLMLGPEQAQVVASTVQKFEALPQLCSPKGSVEILPTVLYLVVGILKETATKPALDTTSILATTPPVQAALHCLRVLASDRYARDPRCSDKWVTLLQSTLGRILSLTKTRGEMLKLVVPCLLHLLEDPSLLSQATPYRRSLHQLALQKLMQIGPQFPQEFRSLMTKHPKMRQKLEAAVKADSDANQARFQQGKESRGNPQPQQQQPSIRLKMDFSNFS
ncbi:unnamed protein product [Darwinula stevensoni]|uniref:HEAT repeat-containing protein 5A n=1 Tax=Darwinula stevensoni TaxID=69355 RepID=A0A7R8X215_9CRUS|nr:unnamed protein product [Darwinula stevensoni]CAG0883432.1 unnamed protein product [Darwinula stevensoni]